MDSDRTDSDARRRDRDGGAGARALPRGDADRQRPRHHAPGARRPGRRRDAGRRGHPPHPQAPGDPRACAAAGGRIVPYHDHNGAAQRPRLLAALAEGPLGGAGLRRRHAARRRPGLPAGRRGDRRRPRGDGGARGRRRCWRRWRWRGCRPTASCSRASCRRGTAARRRALAELAAVPATLVFYESPRRLAASLADMAAVLGEPAGGGLPRAHQALRGGAARRPGGARRATTPPRPAPKGEVVVVAGPPVAAPRRRRRRSTRRSRAALGDALGQGRGGGGGGGARAAAARGLRPGAGAGAGGALTILRRRGDVRGGVWDTMMGWRCRPSLTAAFTRTAPASRPRRRWRALRRRGRPGAGQRAGAARRASSTW